MAKVKEMLLPKDPRYLKYPLEGPFDQEKPMDSLLTAPAVQSASGLIHGG